MQILSSSDYQIKPWLYFYLIVYIKMHDEDSEKSEKLHRHNTKWIKAITLTLRHVRIINGSKL